MMTMAHAQELISGSDRFRGVSRTCLHQCGKFCRLLSSFVLAFRWNMGFYRGYIGMMEKNMEATLL